MNSPLRKEKLPAWVCVGLSAIMFMVAFIVSTIVAFGVLGPWMNDFARNSFMRKDIENTFLLSLPLIASIVVFWMARFSYATFRWKKVIDDGIHCLHCGYNLTGNTSGVCPECGEGI